MSGKFQMLNVKTYIGMWNDFGNLTHWGHSHGYRVNENDLQDFQEPDYRQSLTISFSGQKWLNSPYNSLTHVSGQLWEDLERKLPPFGHPQPGIIRQWELQLHFHPPTMSFVCLCVRPSVCVCGKHLLVCLITHHPFKLGSPNLDNRCKRPWLRSPLFLGVIDLDLKGQIDLQSQNLPHFELVHAITHHQLKLQFPNLEQKFILALFRSLPILGLIEIDLQFNF